MTMSEAFGCDEVRARLGAYHDNELPVDEQVAVAAHVCRCDACHRRCDELALIRDLLRDGAVAETGRLADPQRGQLLTAVVGQALQERRESWLASVGRLMIGAPGVWIPGGALAASVLSAAVLATILSLFTPTHATSLAAVVDRGSNANPVSVFRGVSVPRVSLEAGLPAFLSEPLALPPVNVALSAVVTREGQLSGLTVISPIRALSEFGDLAGDFSRLTANVRFKPARYAGAPVAVNVVWLFEQTTVRPVSPQTLDRRSLPPRAS